ncbi:MAG: SDR family NAD(P)-dependent oxidoreductase [Oscillospiraceae bacterium]
MLKDKVVLITGGNRGIGYATVKLFLENNATVVLAASTQERADEAVAKLKAINPSFKVSGIAPKITDCKEVQAAVDKINSEFGRLDVLISNAGITRPEYGTFYQMSIENFEEVIDVNFKSALYFAHATAPIMKEQGGGVILFTASITAIYGANGNVAYPTSKFAIRGLSRCLAMELGKDKIRVNCVAPGCTDTDMLVGLSDQIRAYLNKSVPLGKIGDPEDVASAFLYLASDMGKHVSGIILPVAGGGTT